jgi:hypothetical protein
MVFWGFEPCIGSFFIFHSAFLLLVAVPFRLLDNSATNSFIQESGASAIGVIMNAMGLSFRPLVRGRGRRRRGRPYQCSDG